MNNLRILKVFYLSLETSRTIILSSYLLSASLNDDKPDIILTPSNECESGLEKPVRRPSLKMRVASLLRSKKRSQATLVDV